MSGRVVKMFNQFEEIKQKVNDFDYKLNFIIKGIEMLKRKIEDLERPIKIYGGGKGGSC